MVISSFLLSSCAAFPNHWPLLWLLRLTLHYLYLWVLQQHLVPAQASNSTFRTFFLVGHTYIEMS